MDDSQTLSSHYASLKKSFQKLTLEFENLKLDKEKLRHEKDGLLKEIRLLQKDVSALKTGVSEPTQNTLSDVSKLQKTVKLLKFDLENMVNGSKNLDLILGSQRPYFEKLGLGYEKKEDEDPPKSSKNRVPTYIYYFKKGHSSEKCFLRRQAKK